MKVIRMVLLWLIWSSQTLAADLVVSESVYKHLNKAHELMEKAQYEQALIQLKKVRPAKTSRYERALVQQSFGHLYASKEEYGKAIEAFEACLELKVFPENAQTNILYNLAQLQLASGNAAKAVSRIEQWFKRKKQTTARAHTLAGAAYIQLEQYTKAIRHLQQAIVKDSKANESNYRRLLAAYYQVGRYETAAQLLEKMTQLFPQRKNYWLQLSTVFRRLQDYDRSLATLELAHQQGMLTSEKELLELIHYYLYLDMPFQAGKQLDKSLREGSVDSTYLNWRLLSDIWLQARETELAISAMQRAAELSRDAESYLRLAQLAAHVEDWELVMLAADQAFQIGGLSDPGQGRLLKGTAYYYQGNDQAASKEFKLASTMASVRTEARNWLDYLASD